MRLGVAAYFSDSVLALATMLALTFTISLDGCLSWLTAAAAGLGAWTFSEYWAHRILYHRVAFFARMHETHHVEPKALIGTPPGLLFALVVILLPIPVKPPV
jgi:sterol desaturase/sphingolipid hydroxylase (fatty acid hydroxylase superfamily)